MRAERMDGIESRSTPHPPYTHTHTHSHPRPQMRAERMDGIDSKRRGRAPEESLRIFGEMQAGSEEGLRHCIRYKMDMQARGGYPGWFGSGHAPKRLPPPCLPSPPRHPFTPRQNPNKALRDPACSRCPVACQNDLLPH